VWGLRHGFHATKKKKLKSSSLPRRSEGKETKGELTVDAGEKGEKKRASPIDCFSGSHVCIWLEEGIRWRHPSPPELPEKKKKGRAFKKPLYPAQ